MSNGRKPQRRREAESLEEIASMDWEDQSSSERAGSLEVLGFGPGTAGIGSDWADLPTQVREAVLEDLDGGGF